MGIMKKSFWCSCTLLFSSLVLSSVSFGETEVKINARLISDEVPFNREAMLTVTATWKGPANAIKIFPVDPPTTTNLKLVSTSTANTVSSQGDIVVSTREYEFYFVGETLGMAYIDEVILRYHDADLQELLTRPSLHNN